MKRYFGIPIHQIRSAPHPLPDSKYIADKVFAAGNKEFVHTGNWALELNWTFIIQCEYQPLDLPLWGLYWEQLPPELF